MEKEDNNNPLVVGFVGHVSIDNLKKFKDMIENTSYFHMVFFKTSSEKLWIKEGGEGNDKQKEELHDRY